MTKQILALMFLSQTAAAQVAAPVRWTKAGALDVALPPAFSAQIQPVSTRLEKTCKAFRDSLVTLSQDPDRARRTFDARRKATDSASSTVFSAEFRTGNLGAANTLQFDATAVQAELDRISGATKSPEMIFAAESIELAATSWGELQIQADAGSATLLAEELGLQPLRIEARLSQGQTAIKVLGKDSVCDLIEGRAKLIARVKVHGTLPEREIRDLRQIAIELRDRIRPQVEGTASIGSRALRTGLRWGGYFDEVRHRLPKSADPIEQSASFLERMLDGDKMQWRQGWSETLIDVLPYTVELKDTILDLKTSTYGVNGADQ